MCVGQSSRQSRGFAVSFLSFLVILIDEANDMIRILHSVLALAQRKYALILLRTESWSPDLMLLYPTVCLQFGTDHGTIQSDNGQRH